MVPAALVNPVSCGRRGSEIAVGVLDHGGADETAGDRLIEVGVVLVGPGPLLSHALTLGPGS
jgi:hypothetical protein